jgi:BirA family transcriptional regulator, biotin operon repressor / biotin---[acetyl-CoA-carboxylase] ligase
METLLPDGNRLTELEETGSTNSDCLQAAMAGDPGGLWISARRQSMARGSRGRDWTSYEGNLGASLLLRQPAPNALLGQLTFVAALAVHEAMEELARDSAAPVQIELKWPNDILANGAKVCGILLESHEIKGVRYVIVGFGANCCSHPQGTTHPATDLMSNGVNVTARMLLDRISICLDRWLGIWDRGRGFARVRESWLLAAKGIGDTIAVKLREREQTGMFEDLDETGRLVLRKHDGNREMISTAEIFYLNSTRAG